jgi:hypothetical protein
MRRVHCKFDITRRKETLFLKWINDEINSLVTFLSKYAFLGYFYWLLIVYSQPKGS